MVGVETGLIDEHASVEIEWRFGSEFRGPLNLIRALLAVPNLVLRGMAPCFLAETVHHSIEVIIWQIKQVVYVIKHLDVSVKIDHLAVLHELLQIIFHIHIRVKNESSPQERKDSDNPMQNDTAYIEVEIYV